MRAQVFTMDLVIGSVIILSILSSAYALSSYYSGLNSSFTVNGDTSNAISSATSAFIMANSTKDELFHLQGGMPYSDFLNYVESTLGKEVSYPYSITVYAQSPYSAPSLPSLALFSYSTQSFSQSSSLYSFHYPILISNFGFTSSAYPCNGACNASLSANSVFPGESSSLNAPKCNVINTSNGAYLPWGVNGSTTCAINVPSTGSPGTPSSLVGEYYVKAYTSGGVYLGETPLYVLGLLVVDIMVQS